MCTFILVTIMVVFSLCVSPFMSMSLSLSVCVCVVHIFSIINCRQSGSFTYDDHTDHIFRKLRYTLQIFNEKKKKMSKDYKSQRNWATQYEVILFPWSIACLLVSFVIIYNYKWNKTQLEIILKKGLTLLNNRLTIN